MFLKLTIFKRLLKAALKGQGLTIGHIDAPAIAGTYVKGSWWTVWFSEWYMPKEIKGELISICGELPDIGEAFEIQGENGESQNTLIDQEIVDIPEIRKNCRYEYRPTRFLEEYNGMIIRYLKEDKTGSIAKVNNMALSMIDPGQIDEGSRESFPVGPVAEHVFAKYVYWYNDRCILRVKCAVNDNDEESAQAFKVFEGSKEKMNE